ncbi:von Willebrand factor A domain-containing protein 8-like [Physella acuta]|uniref:von Willebrand factor A domain-containing protein 8-like n=1 Tax=Physella acuta TaxID=109671 RepID=UPI0027DAC012|nr:von Willebrand factor A domain-containing protein 8-like [Physella acuta]XP_059156252.1 von Willebrand factor A domain-containing protein 8-like [Physella acuta]XP_059156253.1 von Willebrand factor A domain-containing protein 8-like [Physella acuta]XP_059156254.1 von Willebrand factor A domain-containing protein 8-like [Physella acuta]XP_059156256.1 von Willebrand factor A domain-containing protein 8-like [Physella acuta]XP_059156257.1 von Willebrand factor A domain-containing protein 8-lik
MKILVAMENASRRLHYLHKVLCQPSANGKVPEVIQIQVRLISESTLGKKVSIGDVSKVISEPKHPEFVPRKYLKTNISQSTLRHLRWIMQKDSLGQDVFLIGPPGPLRRQIAMMYLELTKREVEYVSLSRDTTESDLKQRREIEGGTAYYIDQCAVRAALEGRVLILEGIEKAERNVLPVLNNLLENREMQLDDGRFLMSAQRYDQLLTDHTPEELDALKLVRVSSEFRVIALGLPIPRYQGNPLDPPLRSRFQARDIHSTPYKELLNELELLAPNISATRLSQLLSFATTLLQRESSTLGLPDFPIDNLPHIVQIMNILPGHSDAKLIQRIYPYTAMLAREGREAVEETIKKFEIPESNNAVGSIEKVTNTGSQAKVVLRSGHSFYTVQVAAGSGTRDCHFVSTPYHNQILAEMIQSHLIKDFCLIGPKGCGKNVVVEKFASLLGYHVEPIMLYQDMTSRDLLQQRTTLANGDTVWRPSPLVTAALEGSLAVLDGLHRVNPGSFAVLHRFVSERELQLFDGTRLLSQEKFEAIKQETGFTDLQLEERKILPIHPSFRMIALSEPPVVGSSKQQWLSPEMLTMFLFHEMRTLSRSEEQELITTLVPTLPDLKKILDFVHTLRTSNDSTLQSLAPSFSTRQLLRIAKRLAQYPSDDLHSIIHKACLARFLPRLAQSALSQTLEEAKILPQTKEHHLDDYEHSVSCEVKNGMARIGATLVPVYQPQNKTKVPDILFYENHQHLNVMEDMLKDFTLGEHLLLVGNQGVGKNKIVDRFLQLLNRPREYIQLHRDTTVQTLTLQPTVRDGVIIYEDSPLVVAVKLGHVLVVDEADKAATNVTCILKSLVQSGEMFLSDGRRIVSANSSLSSSKNIIKTHPDFRMIVLANRPGFPFLGNDFFGAMGDIFSCHAIDNPDMESELAMLKQYGPNVSETTLKRLVSAFAELRQMADQGLINYPYSTREVVNMVRHLENYPNEGLTTVVRNVFDFDSYNKELQETIVETMHKHGIPVGSSQAAITLAKEIPLPPLVRVGQWHEEKMNQSKLAVKTEQIFIRGPVDLGVQTKTLDRTESRSHKFSEEEVHALIPLDEANIVCDVAVSKVARRSAGKKQHDVIYVATCHPIGLYSLTSTSHTVHFIDLYDVFPSTMGSYRPHVRIQPLEAPLDDRIILHEQVTNVVISVNVESGQVWRLMCPGIPEVVASKRRFPSIISNTESPYRMVVNDNEGSSQTVFFYKQNSNEVVILNVLEGVSHVINVPINISNCQHVGEQRWIIQDNTSSRKSLLERQEDNFFLTPLAEEGAPGQVMDISYRSLSGQILSQALEEKVSSPNRLAVVQGSYAALLMGFPQMSSTDVFVSPRPRVPEGNSQTDLFGITSKPKVVNTDRSVASLPEAGQVIHALPVRQVPQEVKSNDLNQSALSGYLEVADVANHKLCYIPIPGPKQISPYASWLFNTSDCNVWIAPTSSQGLVSVDIGGAVRFWETVPAKLEASLKDWRNMLGYEESKPLQLSVERESGRDHEDIDVKHGKEDPLNTPHIGGNTWAGGVGGSGTAGLGGFGGPYRLDAGNQVFQVPQWEKDAVPEHIRQAAREMAQKAYLQRLKEIKMSPYDGQLYNRYSSNIRRQVQSLRLILDSLQAKGKERQWMKHQSSGELDDSKLIDGLTGEQFIYKRRGEKDPEMGSPQELPKRLRLLVDVSGSMYRFDGQDSRLTRQMEAVLMVMEAFETYEDKFKYDIYGHSGETYLEQLVKLDGAPKDNNERLIVLKNMLAHSQFCISGDNTLEAARHHISAISKEEADEHFLILLSDANFDRYGIRPSRFGEILTLDQKVKAFAIFVGSLGDQAVRLNKQLPLGHSYVCLDTKQLPQILQQIFSTTLLSSS